LIRAGTKKEKEKRKKKKKKVDFLTWHDVFTKPIMIRMKWTTMGQLSKGKDQ
jgi:hypothetical protein